MKKLWARISIALTVSDEEYEQIKHRVLDDGLESIPDELAQRFIDDGELDEDSYIPDSTFEFEGDNK